METMNDEQFLTIYEKNKTSVFCIAFSYVKDRAYAEDIMQSVFLKLYSSPPKDERRINGWLATVTRNECLDRLRRNQLEKEAMASFENDPFLQDEKREDFETLFLVDKLPEVYSSVIKLFYYGGLNVKETAYALKISENAVKKRLERARAKLKKLLEEDRT